MTILASGFTGIGTTTPTALLSINANGLLSGAPQFIVGSTTGSNFIITNGGFTGLGTTSPWGLLSVNANGLGGSAPQFVVGSSTTNFIVANNGYVGIGTTSPWGMFSINPNGLANSAPQFVIGSSSVAASFIVTNAGYVGIGTTSPYSLVSIMNNANTVPNTPLFTIASTTGGVSTSTLMTVLANGFVGIGGTSTPIGILDVESSGSPTAYIKTTADSSNSANLIIGGAQNSSAADIAAIQFWNYASQSTGGAYQMSGISGRDPNASATLKNGALLLSTSYSGSLSERMRINQLGDVGIGTTTPNWMFQIATSSIGTTFQGGQLALTDTNAGTNLKHWLFASMGGNLYIGTSSDAYATSSIAALTISSNSYVGIGTTSPGYKLDVAGIVNATALYVNGSPYVGSQWTTSGSNIYYNTGFVGIGSSTPSSVLSISNNLNTTANTPLFTVSSTTGGTSTTTFMTVLSSGNVGINTATPAYNLDVGGSASFGTGGESMRVDTTGFVGIGTSSPYALLSLSNNVNSVVNTPLFVIASTTGGTSTSTLMTVLANGNMGVGTSTPYALLSVESSVSGLTDLFAIATSTSGLVFKINSYGQVYGDGAYSSPAADYAEYFYTNSVDLHSGEIVCIDILSNNSVKRCERGADNNVMGIVSTKPSVIGNYIKAVETDPSHYVIVGMMGQVDAFVTAENGTINIGDSLTTSSSTPGFAMRAGPGDSTVGVALEPFTGDTGMGTGEIKVLISRRNKSLAVEDVESLVADRIANMKIEDVVNQMVSRSVDNLNSKSKLFKGISIDSNFDASSPFMNVDASGNITINGAARADEFIVPAVATSTFTIGTTTFIANIPQEVLTADGDGVDIYKLATFALASVQDLAARLNAQDIRLTSLETRVAALENGTVSSSNGTPELSTSTLASALNSFGVFIQKNITQFGSLVADQFVAATNSAGTSSAGTINILAGNVVAQVSNAYVATSTKVFVTFNSQITGNWWVSDKTGGSFRVTLSAPQTSDVSFDYFLVQTEGQIATSTPTMNIGTSTPDGIESSTPPTDSTGSPPADTGDGSLGGETTNLVVSPPSSGTDTTAPVVTLNGDAAMQINVGDTFADPGATATDYTDGDLTSKIVETGSVDVATAGLYDLTYTATDVAGNHSSVSRVVTVIAAPTTP